LKCVVSGPVARDTGRGGKRLSPESSAAHGEPYPSRCGGSAMTQAYEINEHSYDVVIVGAAGKPGCVPP
jgi:hypothetical protein